MADEPVKQDAQNEPEESLQERDSPQHDVVDGSEAFDGSDEHLGEGSNAVRVDQATARSGDDAYFGSWVDVVNGPHEGRRGAYIQTVDRYKSDGYPKTILVRSRDSRNEILECQYKHVRPALEYNGGR